MSGRAAPRDAAKISAQRDIRVLPWPSYITVAELIRPRLSAVRRKLQIWSSTSALPCVAVTDDTQMNSSPPSLSSARCSGRP